jgi:hypothetical protein
MEGSRNKQQTAAQHVKEQPGNDEARDALSKLSQAIQTASRASPGPYQLFQAGSTQDTVFVFCDAFTAVIASALWTSRYCFARDVIQATLFRKERHGRL